MILFASEKKNIIKTKIIETFDYNAKCDNYVLGNDLKVKDLDIRISKDSLLKHSKRWNDSMDNYTEQWKKEILRKYPSKEYYLACHVYSTFDSVIVYEDEKITFEIHSKDYENNFLDYVKKYIEIMNEKSFQDYYVYFISYEYS